MARFATVAAALGLATGLWSAAAVFLGVFGRTPNLCLAPGLIDCSRVTFAATAVEALGIVLVIDSLLCFVGPKKLFYTSAGISILMAAFAFVTPGDSLVVAATLGLALVESALCLVAARREPSVSEQSHPMNLPVFG